MPGAGMVVRSADSISAGLMPAVGMVAKTPRGDEKELAR